MAVRSRCLRSISLLVAFVALFLALDLPPPVASKPAVKDRSKHVEDKHDHPHGQPGHQDANSHSRGPPPRRGPLTDAIADHDLIHIDRTLLVTNFHRIRRGATTSAATDADALSLSFAAYDMEFLLSLERSTSMFSSEFEIEVYGEQKIPTRINLDDSLMFFRGTVNGLPESRSDVRGSIMDGVFRATVTFDDHHFRIEVRRPRDPPPLAGVHVLAFIIHIPFCDPPFNAAAESNKTQVRKTGRRSPKSRCLPIIHSQGRFSALGLTLCPR